MMWSTKFVMLHIPRTGGSVLTEAFGHLPYVCKDVLRHKHVPAKLARERVVGPEIYDQAHVFCVIRDPWEIAWSYYNLVITSATLPDDGTGPGRSRRTVVTRAASSVLGSANGRGDATRFAGRSSDQAD